MKHENTSHSARHLRAFAWALGMTILFFPCLYFAIPYVVKPFMRDLMARPYDEKDQGMHVQTEAVLRYDVMPVYGSSELRNDVDMKGDEFFRQKPTGFQLCPVGAAGNTTLMMAQKIAAQGTALKGQKIAFIISHTWFRRPETPSAHMEGNFSPLQVISFLQDTAMDEKLRERFVERLTAYPKAMKEHPVINAYLNSEKEEGWTAEVKTFAYDTALRVKRTWYKFEDRLDVLEALFKYEMVGHGRWSEKARKLSWTRLINEKEEEVPEATEKLNEEMDRLNDGSGDEEFLGSMRNAKEWGDFALLLDTLKFYGAKPLIITVPLPGPSLNRRHVSRKARDYYYHRIESMCNERGIPSETFSDQDLASGFLINSGTHLETKGWLYVNRLLDDFYHGRIASPIAENQPAEYQP